MIKTLIYWKFFLICLFFSFGVQVFSTEAQIIKGECSNGFRKGKRSFQFRVDSRKIDSFENRIGYFFKDQNLKKMVLNHSGKRKFSVNKFPGRRFLAKRYFHNRRLEFLGDAIFNLCVNYLLIKRYSHVSRQVQSEKQKYLMSNGIQAKIALLFKLNLDILSNTSKRPGDLSSKLLANVLEALVGAVYLDGGYNEAKRLVMHMLERVIREGAIGKGILTPHLEQVNALNPSVYRSHVQQLKMLGSYVLDLYATEILMIKYPEDNVRRLFEKRIYLKKFVDLNGFDQNFQLKDFDVWDGGPLPYTGFNAFKFLLGIMYFNGNHKKVKKVVKQLVEKASEKECTGKVLRSELANKSYKGLLYTFIQRKFRKIPIYNAARKKGSQYKKVFIMEI